MAYSTFTAREARNNYKGAKYIIEIRDFFLKEIYNKIRKVSETQTSMFVKCSDLSAEFCSKNMESAKYIPYKIFNIAWDEVLEELRSCGYKVAYDGYYQDGLKISWEVDDDD